METTSYITLSRQASMRRALTVTANNIANADTHGFQSEKVLFRHYLKRIHSHQPMAFGEKIALVQDIATFRDTRQGSLEKTGNPLDLAIQGEGFFTIETPLGKRYSRDGQFMLNEEGVLVTSLGNRVLDVNGDAITLPQGSEEIKISSEGAISVRLDIAGGVPVFQEVAQIQAVTFENPQEMKRIEGGLMTAAGEEIPTNSFVLQGMTEKSNTRPIEEITRLIDIQRRYSSGQRLMQSEHERIRRAITVLTDSR